MFKWLENLLMQTPVQSSGCSCCEAKREKLEQMRQNIIADEISDVSEEETDCSVKCSVNFGGVRFNKEP